MLQFYKYNIKKISSGFHGPHSTGFEKNESAFHTAECSRGGKLGKSCRVDLETVKMPEEE